MTVELDDTELTLLIEVLVAERNGIVIKGAAEALSRHIYLECIERLRFKLQAIKEVGK